MQQGCASLSPASACLLPAPRLHAILHMRLGRQLVRHEGFEQAPNANTHARAIANTLTAASASARAALNCDAGDSVMSQSMEAMSFGRGEARSASFFEAE